jgi:tripartite-type tricarboxylate transporter receptor subunit TctC
MQIADWIGIVAPAGTPAPLIQQLNQAFVQVLKTPQIRESLSKAGAQVIASTPQELTEHTHQEFERWQALVKSANIKLD